MSPDERTTEVGLYHFALTYLACADSLRTSPPPQLMFDAPIRFLFWHAAELLMKAYLRATGLSVNELKKIGHSHRQLHEACIGRGLPLSKYPEAFFEFTDESEPIESRYIVTGNRQLPSLDALNRVCNELREVVRTDLKNRGLPVR